MIFYIELESVFLKEIFVMESFFEDVIFKRFYYYLMFIIKNDMFVTNKSIF